MAKAIAPAKPEQIFTYFQACSRCDGSGDDPDDDRLQCDCCDDGTEFLSLTEAQALNYWRAVKNAEK